MTNISTLVQQGTASAWVLVSSALVLGALHGLEPGHSKTMMAAFIVAVRGTIGQAILLALAATVSHTAIVWAIALGGMYFGSQLNAETAEPYLQTASGVLILGIAVWMIFWVIRDQERAKAASQHSHEETRRIDTGHGWITLEIFETGVPPRWRVRSGSGHQWRAHEIKVETTRSGGSSQVFTFVDGNGFAESKDEIPEPHEFSAKVILGHSGHGHSYDVSFSEHDHQHSYTHDHEHEELEGLDMTDEGYQDAHERAHANDIRRRFTNQHVTTSQIIMFGLTGGLIPCGAAVTVLLLCLQLKKFLLGVLLVLCFSVGLAATMMASGVIAAWGVKHVKQRLSGGTFQRFARLAPYLSASVVIVIGLYITWSGLRHLI